MSRGDCMMDGDGCDGTATFPKGDSIGFCPVCWNALSKRTRAKIQRLTNLALKAESVAQVAGEAADTALSLATFKLRASRFGGSRAK